jgi:hypothetical protein
VNIADLSPDAPTAINEHSGRQSSLPYRCDLLPPRALLHEAEILARGAAKYGVDNWRKIGVREHVNHALTHLLAMLAGDGQDDHLGHATCRCLMALEMQLTGDKPDG